MMVRFATTCDTPGCTARRAEYTAWPSCRMCLLDTCPTHTTPGTLDEQDGRETVVCTACTAMELSESTSV